jgi:hypothetical protein
LFKPFPLSISWAWYPLGKVEHGKMIAVTPDIWLWQATTRGLQPTPSKKQTSEACEESNLANDHMNKLGKCSPQLSL